MCSGATRSRASTDTAWTTRTSTARTRTTTGVLGALALPEPGDGSVLPHERTMPKAKSDRLALLRATRLNLDPIWCLSLTEGLTDLIDTSRPLGTCTDEDGNSHSLFGIDDPETQAAISRAVAASPLVLADGHHRFETALTYRDECRRAGAPDPGADAIMTFVVELADDQLSIEPIHRLVHLARSGSESNVRSLLSEAFTITPAGPNTPDSVAELEIAMRTQGAMGLADADGLALLTVDPALANRALADEPPPVAHTDAALVEAVVVPLLAGAAIEYRHDIAGVAALVAKGLADAALLLNPVSVADTARPRWPAPGCRRRRRSSRPSRAPAWSSAPSTDRRASRSPRRNRRRARRSADRPGGAGRQQRSEVAGTRALRRGRELTLHLDLVHRALDIAEHTDRRRDRRRVGEP